MNSKRKFSLKAADGVVLADTRPVSPFSLKGIGRSMASAYDGAVGATTDAIETVAKPFARPAGYTAPQAPALAPAAAPPVAAPALQLGGMNLGVIQRREAAAGLRDGVAFLEGPGGPTDDKIDAKLSRGEAVLPADTVQAIGPANVQALIDSTHTPVKSKGLRHFANGLSGMDVIETAFTEDDAKLFGRRPAGTAAAPQPRVPGIEVHEPFGPRTPGPQPHVQGLRVEFPITDPGPGNPNVGRTPPTPPTAPVAPPLAPAAAAQPAPTGLRDVASAARNVAGGIGSAGANIIRGGAGFAAPVAAYKGLTTDTEQYARRFGLENTEPGILRDMGIRALGVASDVGDAMTFGQASRLFRDQQGATDVTPRPVTTAPAAPVAEPVAQPAARTDAQRGGAAPPLNNRVIPGGAQAAGIQRRGNSFSNTGSYVEDERAAGGISAQNDAAATNLAARSQAQGLRAGLPQDTDLPAGYGATIPGVNAPRSQAEAELAARNASVRSTFDDAGLSARQRVSRDNAARQDATQRELAAMRDATDRRGQDTTAEVAREGQRVSLRGQDLNYDATTRGQDVSSRTAAAKARQDQANSDRQYNLDVQRFGVDVAEKNRAAATASQESFRKSMETRFRTRDDKGNDVPDTAKVAAFSTAVTSTLPRMIDQLEARGTPEALAKAQALRQRGVAAMEPADIDGMQRLFDIRERMRASKGMGPNQATFAESDNLLDYRQTGTQRRAIGGDRVVTPAGSVSINDLRYSEGPANLLLPDFFKTENRNLTRGLRME